MKKVKTRLEEKGFNLPADIRELEFYDAPKTFPVKMMQDDKPGGTGHVTCV
jgi:hypothetical protein